MDKTFWFPVWHGTKAEPVKVVCNCVGWDLLQSAGFVKDMADLPDDKPVKSESFVDTATSKDDIESYVKLKTGVDIDKRGSLETVKAKAKAALNESGRIN